jgi:hypothetical protein
MIAVWRAWILKGRGVDRTRRGLLGALVAGGMAPLIAPTLGMATSTEETPQNFRWRVPVAHVETVKNNLRFDGSVTNEKDEKGIPLMFVFLGAVLLPYLADAVLALRRDIVYGGVVIDMRGSEIVIENDKRLDSGVILVITPDGSDFYERDDIKAPNELVAALLKGK